MFLSFILSTSWLPPHPYSLLMSLSSFMFSCPYFRLITCTGEWSCSHRMVLIRCWHSKSRLAIASSNNVSLIYWTVLCSNIDLLIWHYVSLSNMIKFTAKSCKWICFNFTTYWIVLYMRKISVFLLSRIQVNTVWQCSLWIWMFNNWQNM